MAPSDTVVEARNLKSADTFSKNDPYVRVELPGSTQKFQVCVSAVCGMQDVRAVCALFAVVWQYPCPSLT